MKRPAIRRTTLLAAGMAAFAAFAAPAFAETMDMRGTIRFENGAVIPKGRIQVYIDDPAAKNEVQRTAAGTGIESDGKSKSLDFVLPPQASQTARAASPAEIVARLEREDGWLLARGSAEIDPAGDISITLFTAMY